MKQVSNEQLLLAVAQSEPPLDADEWRRFLAWLGEPACPATPAALLEQDGGRTDA